MSTASTSSGATASDETNECCVCFRTYSQDVLEGTGFKWVECVCGRWLHEDCISYDISTDANRKELLCLFVVHDHYNTIYVLLTSDAATKIVASF